MNTIKKNSKKGFTLVELVVVIAILVAIVGVGTVISSVVLRAKSYSQIITVDETYYDLMYDKTKLSQIYSTYNVDKSERMNLTDIQKKFDGACLCSVISTCDFETAKGALTYYANKSPSCDLKISASDKGLPLSFNVENILNAVFWLSASIGKRIQLFNILAGKYEKYPG